MNLDKILSDLQQMPYHELEDRIGSVIFPQNTPQDVAYVFRRYRKIVLFSGTDETNAPFENTVTLEPIFTGSVSDSFPENLGDGFEGYKNSYYMGHFSSGDDQIILDMSRIKPVLRSHIYYPPLPFEENVEISDSLESFLKVKLNERPVESIYTKNV